MKRFLYFFLFILPFFYTKGYGQNTSVKFVQLDAKEIEKEELWNAEAYGKFDRTTEIINKRDEFSKHFLQEDGSLIAHISAGPIHYFEKGEWHSIYHSISSTKNGFENIHNNFTTSFPQFSIGKIKTNLEKKQSISESINEKLFFLAGKQPLMIQKVGKTKGNRQSNQINYTNIYNSIDFQITQQTTGREANYIIKNPDAIQNIPKNTSHLVFEKTIEIPKGWDANLAKNQIVVKDEKGKTKAIYDRPIAKDGSSKKQDNSNSEIYPNPNSVPPSIRVGGEKSYFVNQAEGEYKIIKNGKNIVIQTLIPIEWFLSPNRIFPLVINETAQFSYFNKEALSGYIKNKGCGFSHIDSPRNNMGDMYLGLSKDNNFYYNLNPWMKFNISSISKNHSVLSAELGTFVNHIYSSITNAQIRGIKQIPTLTRPNELLANIQTNQAYSKVLNFNSKGWKTTKLDKNSTLDIQSQLSSGWFSAGYKPTDSYYCDDYVVFSGFSSAHKPYIRIKYSETLSPIVSNMEKDDVDKKISDIYSETTLKLSTGFTHPYTLEQGLVLHHSFDESETEPKEYLPNWRSDGYIGGTYEFTGEKGKYIPGNVTLKDNNWTISSWIKKTAHKISEQSNNPLVFWSFSKQPSAALAASVSATITVTYMDENRVPHILGSSTHPNLNEWYLVTVTSDHEGVKLYVNGQLEDKNLELSSDIEGDFEIGRAFGDDKYRAIGFIDDFRVYDRALSDTEILSLYFNDFSSVNILAETERNPSDSIDNESHSDEKTFASLLEKENLKDELNNEIQEILVLPPTSIVNTVYNSSEYTYLNSIFHLYSKGGSISEHENYENLVDIWYASTGIDTNSCITDGYSEFFNSLENDQPFEINKSLGENYKISQGIYQAEVESSTNGSSFLWLFPLKDNATINANTEKYINIRYKITDIQSISSDLSPKIGISFTKSYRKQPFVDSLSKNTKNAAFSFRTSGITNVGQKSKHVIADGNWHIVSIPIHESMAWNGKVTGLRLDYIASQNRTKDIKTNLEIDFLLVSKAPIIEEGKEITLKPGDEYYPRETTTFYTKKINDFSSTSCARSVIEISEIELDFAEKIELEEEIDFLKENKFNDSILALLEKTDSENTANEQIKQPGENIDFGKENIFNDSVFAFMEDLNKKIEENEIAEVKDEKSDEKEPIVQPKTENEKNDLVEQKIEPKKEITPVKLDEIAKNTPIIEEERPTPLEAEVIEVEYLAEGKDFNIELEIPKKYLPDFNSPLPATHRPGMVPSFNVMGSAIALLVNLEALNLMPPVADLIDFQAEYKENKSIISWTTASETNSNYFLLEYSKDGQKWVTIAKEKAMENSTTIHRYEVEDSDFKMGYYRLRQIDMKGNVEVFSSVAAIDNSFGKENNLKVYPDSKTEQIVIEIDANQEWGDSKLIFRNVVKEIREEKEIFIKKGKSLIFVDRKRFEQDNYVIFIENLEDFTPLEILYSDLNFTPYKD